MTPEIAWQDSAPDFAQGLAVLYGEAFRGGGTPASVWLFGNVLGMGSATFAVPGMTSRTWSVPGMASAAFGVPRMVNPDWLN